MIYLGSKGQCLVVFLFGETPEQKRRQTIGESEERVGVASALADTASGIAPTLSFIPVFNKDLIWISKKPRLMESVLYFSYG